MTISQSLLNATSGLAAASRRASVTSNNIANALTEGYSRREVGLTERVVAGAGAGVDVAGVSRATNPAVTYERRLADTEFAFNSATAGALTRITDLLGGPEDPSALFQKYANLESALKNLAETPDSGALQQQGVTSANDLAATFNRLSEAYQKIRADADAEINNRVNTVNEALQQIEDLNASIGRGSANGTDVTALLDQRQQLIDTVNENIPVRELQRENGKVDLMTPEGVFLLAGSARTVEFTASPVITPGNAYDNGAGALSDLSVGGTDITPFGPGGQSAKSGALAGLFNVRDNVVPEQSAALDSLAFDLIGRFQDPSVDPTLNPGDPGLFTDGGAAADVANITGLAGRIAVNASVDPAQGGETWRLRDGVQAVIPAAAGSEAFVRAMIAAMSDSRPSHAALQSPGDLSAAESAAHLTSLAGGARAVAAGRESASASLAQGLKEAETLETGVDTDRELQNLLVIEQAYAANARVLQTIDQMIQRLMEI
ncbi:flagellar hook-associated protein FlgK [Hyphococcus sp.]|uniref:flagellar hook-associated protein FlgK n=1 Tax=Hyphococcus sp. TaxID=2038636 RepID=UPI003CCB875E